MHDVHVHVHIYTRLAQHIHVITRTHVHFGGLISLVCLDMPVETLSCSSQSDQLLPQYILHVGGRASIEGHCECELHPRQLS